MVENIKAKIIQSVYVFIIIHVVVCIPPQNWYLLLFINFGSKITAHFKGNLS